MFTYPAAPAQAWCFRESPPLFGRPDSPGPVRVAVFGSFHGGFHVLRALLEGPWSGEVRVTGVATDDPSQDFTHAKVRLWKYPHAPAEEEMVAMLAEVHDLPVYRGRITTPEFHRQFVEEWRPDLCLMATFGQMIPRRLFDVPRLGFFNFHHSGDSWPSYPGPDPIRDMLRDGRRQVFLTLHAVSEVLDGGRFVARSHAMPLSSDANAVTVHRATWPQMDGFIHGQVRRIIGQRVSQAGSADPR